ncbi:hypothetical protein CDL15_Pgr021882 [Punica granatum]|uniref:Uncharacterized protein n=1 Tax=Punica granatum TaxID=22663 RepID=A0A218WS84_PUNGR|nr:hypothetical protein CDL15_Pgr021882 [Punica granatum]
MDHGFSWSGNPIGKYRGKRMRIDYFYCFREVGRLAGSSHARCMGKESNSKAFTEATTAQCLSSSHELAVRFLVELTTY